MDILKRFEDRIKDKGLSVVFPEGRDQRIIRAARRLKDAALAEPVVLGTPEQLDSAMQQAGTGLEGIRTINPKDSDELETYALAYSRRRTGISHAVARRVVSKPLAFAGMMVACGGADAMVAGAAGATATVIQSAVLTIGLAPGIGTASSYFLMVLPEFQGRKNKMFIFADCAVNVAPAAEQLADIAIASAASAATVLDEEPRVALLSFSTKGSGSGPSVEKVRRALAIARDRQPCLAIDGEFQADSAIVPAVAAKKVKQPSAVAGRANVLIFPELDSANVAYKLTQYLAGAKAIGPFLQGFARPVCDLSRGAAVDDVCAAAVLTLAQALAKAGSATR